MPLRRGPLTSQVSLSFLFNETVLFTQEGGLLNTCSKQENTADTLALEYLKR